MGYVWEESKGWVWKQGEGTKDPIYEQAKRYREARAARTAEAYRSWNRIRQQGIRGAEFEFDRRERIQLYHWLKAHAQIFQEESA